MLVQLTGNGHPSQDKPVNLSLRLAVLPLVCLASFACGRAKVAVRTVGPVVWTFGSTGSPALVLRDEALQVDFAPPEPVVCQ